MLLFGFGLWPLAVMTCSLKTYCMKYDFTPSRFSYREVIFQAHLIDIILRSNDGLISQDASVILDIFKLKYMHKRELIMFYVPNNVSTDKNTQLLKKSISWVAQKGDHSCTHDHTLKTVFEELHAPVNYLTRDVIFWVWQLEDPFLLAAVGPWTPAYRNVGIGLGCSVAGRRGLVKVANRKDDISILSDNDKCLSALPYGIDFNNYQNEHVKTGTSMFFASNNFPFNSGKIQNLQIVESPRIEWCQYPRKKVILKDRIILKNLSSKVNVCRYCKND